MIYGTVKSFCFYSKKRFLFSLKCYYSLFLVLFWPNLNEEKFGIFWPKAWVNPFGKMQFLRLWKIFFLQSKNVSFLSRTLLNLICSLSLSENKKWKNWHFWPKAWVNPFGKMKFLRLWNFFFIVKKKFLFYLEHY